MSAVKFRIPRYVWIVGLALSLGLAAFAASRDVWGRTDQRGTPPQQQGQGKPSGDPRQGVRFPAPPGEWWKDDEIRKEIRLTPAQSAKIEQIFRAREREYSPYAAEFDKQRDETNRMARERKVSVEEFALQMSRWEAIRAKLNESRYVMLYRMSKELTPEQNAKLDEIRERRSQSRDRSGPR